MARVDTLPQAPFPLPDPAIVLQDVWITQGGRDFSISPTRLGSIQQGTIAPVNPFENQLWWDSSGTLIPGQTVLRAWQKGAWVEVGPLGDAFGNVTVPGTLTVTGGEIKGANAQGFLEIASNLAVDGGTIGGKNNGPLTTTGDFTVGGKLTADGTTTLKAATMVTGGLTTDNLTVSGVTTLNGSLTVPNQTITGAVTGNNGTFSGFLTVNGTLTANSGVVFKGGMTGDTLTLNGTAPQLTLSNGTSNWIQYGNAGVSPPTLSTHSPGTKLLLEPIASPTSYDYAIGLQFGAIWFSAAAYAFYGLNGPPATLQVDGSGNLSIASPMTTISGNANINYIVPSSGTTLVTGSLEANGSINATQNVSVGLELIATNLHSNGDTSVGNNLFVTQTISSNALSIVNGNASGTFGVQGSAVLSGGLDISGIFPNSGGNSIFINGQGFVTGQWLVQGPLVVNGLNSIFTQGLVVNAAPGHIVALETNGDLEVFGDAFANSWQINPSAAALKRDVGGFGRGLDAIKTLRPVSYRLERSPRRLHGLIAEEVEAAIPEAVGHGTKPDSKTLDVMVLISTLINGLRELSEKVDELERVQSRPRQ